MKTYREFYNEMFGRYPGYAGEIVENIYERVFTAFALYVDYVVKEKFGEMEQYHAELKEKSERREYERLKAKFESEGKK